MGALSINRLRLREDLKALEGRVERYGHRYAALLCDIDRFKLYNDACGHLAGDEVLRAVADALVGACRRGDAVYRYGGEEMLVVLPEQSRESAVAAGERARTAVEALSIPHPGIEPPGLVTISIAVGVWRRGQVGGFEPVLRRADEALYRAKERGPQQGGCGRASIGGDERFHSPLGPGGPPPKGLPPCLLR
jgi:diguanylate cyclase (GGDEF)-like protein